VLWNYLSADVFDCFPDSSLGSSDTRDREGVAIVTEHQNQVKRKTFPTSISPHPLAAGAHCSLAPSTRQENNMRKIKRDAAPLTARSEML